MRVRLFILFLFVSANAFAQRDSLDLKIGQMILIGFPGTTADPNVLKEIREGKVGTILIFEKNIPPKNSYQDLKKIIWTYQQAAPIPLFIAIDQEGGRVNRLKEKYGFPRSISAAKLGKYALDSVQFYAQTTAATLAGLGINVNFAPVVDLASNPTNPIIAKVERAYSANPDSVALFAQEVVNAHRKLGIISVLKHFPGHGSSKDDTHLGIADVSKTWNRNELTPYQKLISSGQTDAVMTAHIVNRQLDDKALPGTLSHAIISGILRDQLKFNGVVFSDDMQMHAITKHYGFEEAIKLSILAGVDILTFSNNISGSQERTVEKVHQIIRKLVENGTIAESRIDASFKRIMALKKRIGGVDVAFYEKQLYEKEQQIEKLKLDLEQKVQSPEQPEVNTEKATKKKKKNN